MIGKYLLIELVLIAGIILVSVAIIKIVKYYKRRAKDDKDRRIRETKTW